MKLRLDFNKFNTQKINEKSIQATYCNFGKWSFSSA